MGTELDPMVPLVFAPIGRGTEVFNPIDRVGTGFDRFDYDHFRGGGRDVVERRMPLEMGGGGVRRVWHDFCRFRELHAPQFQRPDSSKESAFGYPDEFQRQSNAGRSARQ
jgi:hypothetical protein